MNLQKLKQAEQRFFRRYPLGFHDPEMLVLAKKHKMDSLIEFAQQEFAEQRFKDPRAIVEAMTRLVSRSSMVSMFEKPRFRDYVRSMSGNDRNKLSQGLRQLLHGDQEEGFDVMVATLASVKLAKWSLVTILPNYYAPDDEVFVKPTTAKGVIDYFELKNLDYSAKPGWDFYERYRAMILKMRKKVDKSLAPTNAAFCGFLMMSMDG